MPNIYAVPVRVALLVALAFVSIASGGALAYLNLKDALFEQKRVELRHESETLMSVIDGFQQRASRGEMTVEAAKAAAKDAIRPVRFGEDHNYFFVYELDGTTILLPSKPELEGKSALGILDQTGQSIVRHFIDNARAGRRHVFLCLGQARRQGAEPQDGLFHAGSRLELGAGHGLPCHRHRGRAGR